jgi:hypothetical protein
MEIFGSILTENLQKRKWIAVFTTVTVCLLLLILAIYGLGEYGIAIFVLIPLLLGMLSTIILGYSMDISLKQARHIGFLTLLFFTCGLIIFALEGLICIAMAAPFGIILTWVGTLIGYVLIKKKPNQALPSILILLVLIPFSAFRGTKNIPPIKPIITKTIINASPETVWQNVIAFPELDQPDEFLFKIGISYPIKSRIEGSGVGAIRFCQFNTGDFVEPITSWEENELLAFDVLEQPEPLREISFWDVNSPHLHDYFISKKGQFKITDLGNGRVELEGTTWYYHNIKPDFYWRLWSDMIIHKIHNRVLDHIKEVSENS